MSTELNEKCAVFGIFGKNLDVSRLSFYGLFALQHRGQEATGIAVADGEKLDCFKDIGLVTQVYTEDKIQDLKGHIAIGQNLYSTFRTKSKEHIQPVLVGRKPIALAHNGNLPSVTALKEFFVDKEIDVSKHNDSELMAEAISYYYDNGLSLEESVRKAFPLFTGGFSLVVMSKDTLVAVRDQYGVRPLAVGKLDEGYCFASETCAFHTIAARYFREVHPGEMVVLKDDDGLVNFESHQIVEPNLKLDIFEFVYFSRPDSNLLGKSVYEVRYKSGLELAKEYPLDVDLIVPVPDTAIPAATGYANALKIPFEMALVKNKYIHRTFIQPDQRTRDLGVKIKLTPLREIIAGKRIALLDDSIVRGTTSQQIVKAMFEAGAIEVHFLVSSPPVKFPDFYGIDTPRQKQLIAASKSVSEIEAYLGATSLHYLSLEALVRATDLPEENFSLACFNGDYPIDLRERQEEVSYSV